MKDNYITIELSTSNKCEVKQGIGIHYFTALLKSGGRIDLLIKFLMIELVKINGNDLTEEQIDDMPLEDIVAISEVISSMIIKVSSSIKK